MKYPKLTELNTSREMVDVFGGYNHNLRIGLGEFYDMKNLTSDDYPVLSPRRQRGVYAPYHENEYTPENTAGMISKDSLVYVADAYVADDDGGDGDGDGVECRIYINGYKVENSDNAEMNLYRTCDSCNIKNTCENYKAGSTLCKKTLISMGAYIIIMPDKKYVNTLNPSDCGEIEAEFETTASTTFTLCKLDGTAYDIDDNIGATAPPLPTDEEGNPKDEHDNLTLWLDTSGETPVLKQYAKTSHQWVSVATTYIKIASTGIGTLFAEGDGVKISGIQEDAIKDLDETNMVIQGRGDDYIIVTGILRKIDTQEDNPIKVERKMPNMDFIIESENRLWGCRYGEALNGTIVNEIYASKLGDFKNWNCFHTPSVSTDSYVASVGTDGQFTGAITHLGYPLFFKENCVHKIYGNYPANFQIQTTACRGVQKGCSQSLAIVNEALYYKARTAVCAYDGSLPVEISSALGDMAYSDAVAGSLGNKYYISMQDTNEDYHLFVYDTLKGMWHREDGTKVMQFCNCRGELYFIDYGDKQIKTVRGTGTLDTSAVQWEAVTGVLGTDSPDKKYISRIDVRLLLSIGSKVSIYAEYDSGGDWEHLLTMNGVALRSFAIPVRPKRCDHLRLKISGVGDVKIYSICKTVEQGSDV